MQHPFDLGDCNISFCDEGVILFEIDIHKAALQYDALDMALYKLGTVFITESQSFPYNIVVAVVIEK